MENARKLLYLDIIEEKERDRALEEILMSDKPFQVTTSFISDICFQVDLSNMSETGELKPLLGDWTSDLTRETVEDSLFSEYVEDSHLYPHFKPHFSRSLDISLSVKTRLRRSQLEKSRFQPIFDRDFKSSHQPKTLQNLQNH
jgi:hypothetical protein